MQVVFISISKVVSLKGKLSFHAVHHFETPLYIFSYYLMLITQPPYSWPFYGNIKKKCGDIDIQKSNGNLFGQVAVLNCQKNSKWFWKAPEIYQLRFINAE